MESKITRFCMRFLAMLALSVGLTLGSFAQNLTDPDPNSPTPLLLTNPDSISVLAHSKPASGKAELARSSDAAFIPESKITLYVTNLDLMEGEGANAFRVYAQNAKGNNFRFPVLEISPISDGGGIYAMTILLKDEIGYWAAPEDVSGMTLYLTWRGLASNYVTLGGGASDGRPAKAGGKARPFPISMALDKTKVQEFARILAPEYVGYRWSGDRMRLQEQAAFGPSPALDSRIRRIGPRTWLAEQFETPYPSPGNLYPNLPLKGVNQDTVGTGCGEFLPSSNVTYQVCVRDHYTQYQPQTWFFKEAFYGDPQLKHRAAWALSQIWVTSGNDIQQGRHIVEWHKVLSKHAFGNYRNLMKEMTLNPTMGEYLNMRESTRTAPNENYAREVAQLFSIGLFMLNQDGTLQRDGQNNPIPTYTQEEINALTRVFTGWSFCSVASPTTTCPNIVIGTVNFIDPMLLNPGLTAQQNRHDIGAKTLFTYPGSAATQNIAACPATGTGACGITCPTTGTANCTLQAGFTSAQALAATLTYANNSMDRAIDNLYNHPNVGPFVSKNLIQQMVTSDPSPAYVSRVAGVFNANRTNPEQMKEVIKAILLDPEARGDVKTDPNYGKLREPVQYFTNFARNFGVRSANGTGQSDGNVAGGRVCGRAEFNNMAQVPFMSPTVFNYFPPDYGIPGTSLVGPEFAIMTTGTAVARATFMNRLTFAATTAPTTTPTAAYAIPYPISGVDCPNGTSFDFSDLVALSQADTTGNLLVDELNRRMLHSTMSQAMKTSIVGALASYAGTTALTHESRVRQALYLVATSSQFQVQR
ncbi:MAG: DUF1800 family protein [Pyrinomonadaceae bacterium]|nr:DUF1800 family protein [Pyrinomonadaceae bacterium]